MTAVIACIIFAVYLAAGIAEQARVVRELASMAKTSQEAGYDA